MHTHFSKHDEVILSFHTQKKLLIGYFFEFQICKIFLDFFKSHSNKVEEQNSFTQQDLGFYDLDSVF